MPIYKVTDQEGGVATLVDATSKSAALRHVAGERFAVDTIQSPTEVARLMTAGVKFATAADDGEPGGEGEGGNAGDPPAGEQRSGEQAPEPDPQAARDPAAKGKGQKGGEAS